VTGWELSGFVTYVVVVDVHFCGPQGQWLALGSNDEWGCAVWVSGHAKMLIRHCLTYNTCIL
jgi:hypothetical protein